MAFRKKSPLAAVFDRVRSPFVCGGHKYYDSLLEKAEIGQRHVYPQQFLESKLTKTWEVFRQTFIDECFNKGSGKKWTAVPFLDIVDSPCATGSVILCTNREIKQKLTGQPKPAFFAGHANDFYPQDRDFMLPPIAPKTTPLRWRNYFRVYQSRRAEKAVMISLTLEDKSEIEERLTLDSLFLDLDNFEDTGFQHKYCYVVTKVLTARSLKIEFTDDGEVFYETEFKAAVPICFQAAKVHVLLESAGLLKRIEPVTGVLNLNYRKRRNWQNFLNAFIPNQNRLGHSSGDYPNSMQVRKSTVLRSYRPHILPRPNRRKNDLVWYFDHVSELRSIRLNFQQDWDLNRRLWLDKAVDDDDDDDDDDDEEQAPYTYYPQPSRQSIEYEDFEW
ncbi:uncharacterized protein LOC123559176 [Mercenaria mercenaria]|uniref:uncharacterized protein LOC123559176 n=1 Tax=Mercenaria mercenaria TaxID=6596 RepID=UPI00234F12CB|nr:uncharacterized protein LOC123559176 [Mercenaria mercenaria]